MGLIYFNQFTMCINAANASCGGPPKHLVATCLVCKYQHCMWSYTDIFLIYCKFGNFRENSIFASSVKRHFDDFKTSQLRHDLPISVSYGVISPFRNGFIFTKHSFVKIKTSQKFPNLQYFCCCPF